MIKIIAEKDYEQLETEINIFEESHEVLDIQVNTHLDTWYATIIYKEINDNYTKLKEMNMDEMAQFFHDYTKSVYGEIRKYGRCSIYSVEDFKNWLEESV